MQVPFTISNSTTSVMLLSTSPYESEQHWTGMRKSHGFSLDVTGNSSFGTAITLRYSIEEEISNTTGMATEVIFQSTERKVSLSLNSHDQPVPIWLSYKPNGKWTLCVQYTDRCKTLDMYSLPFSPLDSHLFSEFRIGPAWRFNPGSFDMNQIKIRDVWFVEEHMLISAFSGLCLLSLEIYLI